jgi:hypothetical protein
MVKHIFSIIDYPVEGQNFGKFSANYPSQAAAKAFSKLSNKYEMMNTFDNKTFLKFTLINLDTRRKNTYIGTKIKLYSPVIINGNEFHYKNLITPYPKHLDIKEISI